MTDGHSTDGDQGNVGTTSHPRSTPAEARLPTETVRDIESLVTEWLHDGDIPGVSVAIVDGDGECYAAGFGARDLETNAPATPDTLYGMGSTTKPVTSLAVIQLVEAGRLALDDPVDDYVGHFATAPGEPITIEELLTHTSGMPSTPTELWAQTQVGYPAGIADGADFERFVRDSTGFRDIDEQRFFYYNTGYSVLGQVIQVIDGRTYAEYVGDEIFDPLGMDRASFSQESLTTDEDAMTGYRPGDADEPPEAAPLPLHAVRDPSGNMIASVRELSRFLRAMMTDGSLGETRVCAPETLDYLQEGRSIYQTLLDGTETEYGCAWMRHPLGTDEVVGHTGGKIGSTAYLGYLETAGYGVVVACNTSADPPNLGRAILALVNGDPKTVLPTLAFEEKCEAVTGTYASFREDRTVTVERTEQGLLLTLENPLGQDELYAVPASLDPGDHEFYIPGPGIRGALEFDLDGEHDELYLFNRFGYRRQKNG